MNRKSEIIGVIVIARNGDRSEFIQDPKTYAGSPTETTPLGEVQSYKLGKELREIYLESGSPSYIKRMQTSLVDNDQVRVRVKAGGEGTVVFDSAIALLQGLFPPNPRNSISLSNGTEIVAPLGGYQYVPVETVEPGNDRSLESWTSCPAFENHIAAFHASDEFRAKEREAEPFFKGIKDFVFGRALTLENIWNIYDFVNTEWTHNRTYAYRLPPTFIEQARGWVNYHENGIFSDRSPGGIGNIAGRTVLHTILSSLERIAFNGDPLQFLLVETTYQPFISLFHETAIFKVHPELQGIPDYASALAIELLRGPPPDTRDFLRFKFKNGTDGEFELLHVFGHHSDIPLTEFIYRIENTAISSDYQWSQVCNAGVIGKYDVLDAVEKASGVPTTFMGALVFVVLLGLLLVSSFVKRRRAKREERRVRLDNDEDMAVASLMPPPVVEKVRLV